MPTVDSIEEWGKSWRDLAQKLEGEKAALIRRVERLAAGLEKFANATVWLDIGTMKAIAAEALKEEPDSVG